MQSELGSLQMVQHELRFRNLLRSRLEVYGVLNLRLELADVEVLHSAKGHGLVSWLAPVYLVLVYPWTDRHSWRVYPDTSVSLASKDPRTCTEELALTAPHHHTSNINLLFHPLRPKGIKPCPNPFRDLPNLSILIGRHLSQTTLKIPSAFLAEHLSGPFVHGAF